MQISNVLKISITLSLLLILTLVNVVFAEGETGKTVGYKHLGAGLAMGLAGLGAGIGLGIAGAAASSSSVERPELFSRYIVYLALAEAVAIYGLVVALMILMM